MNDQIFHDENFEKFWTEFPRQRRGSKDKANAAWLQALKRTTSQEILSGLSAYTASDEVSKGFAKGAAAWLNDDRWTTDYSATSRNHQAKSQSHKPDYFQRTVEASRRAIQNIEKRKS